MAKKIVGFIKLQCPAGKANPSPPIGPALGLLFTDRIERKWIIAGAALAIALAVLALAQAHAAAAVIVCAAP
jgi:hypothetical protein